MVAQQLEPGSGCQWLGVITRYSQIFFRSQNGSGKYLGIVELVSEDVH